MKGNILLKSISKHKKLYICVYVAFKHFQVKQLFLQSK